MISDSFLQVFDSRVELLLLYSDMVVFDENVLSVFYDISHFVHELLRVINHVFWVNLHDTCHLNIGVAYRETQALAFSVRFVLDLWHLHRVTLYDLLYVDVLEVVWIHFSIQFVEEVYSFFQSIFFFYHLHIFAFDFFFTVSFLY